MSNNKTEKRKKRKIYWLRVFLFLLILGAIIYLFVSTITKKPDNISNDPTSNENIIAEEPVIEDITIDIGAIGDIMCHSPNYKAAYDASSKTYNFSPFFTQIAEYTSTPDITIGNLETTFAGESRGYSGYPTFNSPSELGQAIKDIGVDVLCTANNHCIDKGYSGIVNTLDTLDELGLSHMGTSRSSEEQNKILTKNVNGINIAFLAFTYGTNGITIPSGKEYSVNLIDKDLIAEQINLAKELDVDLICVNMHWGIEYSTTPNSEQKQLADFLFENGVDIILGSHPHVLQPMEKRTVTLEDGSKKDGFLIYSLGNFISNQSDINTRDTVILDIKITKSGKDGKITIDEVNYTPVYCYNKGAGSKNRYELIDLNTALSSHNNGTKTLSSSLYNTFNSALQRIQQIIKSV